MKIDSTKPWVESTPKKPKLGEVIKAIIDVQTSQADTNTEVNEQLDNYASNVENRISEFNKNVTQALTDHTSKKGPVHGETKATIGLSKKENLPAANPSTISTKLNNNQTSSNFDKEWVTPKVLSLFLHTQLDIPIDTYFSNDLLPISAGRILGKTLTNQMFLNNEMSFPKKYPSGRVSYLLSGEENYILFAEFGQGRVTKFHRGGEKAPIGVNHIDIHEGSTETLAGNIYVKRGQAVSANHLTMKRNETSAVDTTQEVEAALFDPTVVYTSKNTLYCRNVNTTKHFFNELSVVQNGKYPFNNVVFLSSDRFLSYLANTRLTKQNNRWGIMIDFVTGDIGIPDWYPDNINRNTDKVLSKQAKLSVRTTAWDNVAVTGYETASVISNNAIGSTTDPKYLSLFIPINSFIKNFDTLSSANQQTFINQVDTELLVCLSSAWRNVYNLNGVFRIPFYYTVPNTEDAWSSYLDVEFTVTQSGTTNTVNFAALNFVIDNRPSIGSDLQLTLPDATRFKKWPQTIDGNPFHPKVFRGCFAETGGHVTAYNAGHRQYVCYYKHGIKSIKQWIIDDATPEYDEKNVRVVDTAMMPANRFYNDNTRIVPVNMTDDTITYLTRARNNNGRYGYGTFTIPNDGTFDVIQPRQSQSSEITWLNSRVNGNIPLVINNRNLTAGEITSTALVFSESNGFTGYQTHGFLGANFNPSGVTTIDKALMLRIKLAANIVDPYMIFFYNDEVLYWAIASRSGQKNANGKDVCVGGIRVDTLYDGSSYTIRPLPGMVMKNVWGVLYNDYPAGMIRGRESESFDDVFIINTTGSNKTASMFVNYPDLDGRYYRFTVTADADGYYYPSALNNTVLDLKKECGYDTTCPYVLFGTQFTPFMLPTKFYVPSSTDLFDFTCYTKSGSSVVRSYWNGWVNEQPLFVVGENIIINGRQHTLKQNLTIPNDKSHKGKVIINYSASMFNVYSSSNNPLSYTTEPDTATLFVGFLEFSGNNAILTYHAPRGNSDIANQDFVNSLLPVIDGKQMCTESRGSTFPAMLGTVVDYPRQYFFKK